MVGVIEQWELLAGQTFDHAIEQQLEAAGSVVVLWSEHSVASEWVRNEAAVASERDTLVPALIDTVRLPLEFRRRHTADLTRWTGDPADPEFLALCDGIAAKSRATACAGDSSTRAARVAAVSSNRSGHRRRPRHHRRCIRRLAHSERDRR